MTSGKHNVVSFISNVSPIGVFTAGISGVFPCAGTAACVITSVKTQLDQVKVKAQLINDIFNVLQKFLRCFNSTTDSTSFINSFY